MAAGRMTEEQDLLAIRRLARENKAMALPLRRANDEVYMLKEQLREHEAEKEELRNVTATLLAVEHESKSYDWEKEVLTQRLARAEHEVKELNEKYLEVLMPCQASACSSPDTRHTRGHRFQEKGRQKRGRAV